MKRIAVFLTVLLIVALLFLLPADQGLRAQAKQHAIVLTWAAGVPQPALGQTADVSYNVYRGLISGGPYTEIAAAVTVTSFSDTTGLGGVKYFYVVTGVDSGGFESSFSNEASATFLGLPAIPTGNTASAK